MQHISRKRSEPSNSRVWNVESLRKELTDSSKRHCREAYVTVRTLNGQIIKLTNVSWGTGRDDIYLDEIVMLLQEHLGIDPDCYMLQYEQRLYSTDCATLCIVKNGSQLRMVTQV